MARGVSAGAGALRRVLVAGMYADAFRHTGCAEGTPEPVLALVLARPPAASIRALVRPAARPG